MYLWSGDTSIKEGLGGLQEKYIGSSDEGYRRKAQKIIPISLSMDRSNGREGSRQVYFKKYPRLEPIS